MTTETEIKENMTEMEKTAATLARIERGERPHDMIATMVLEEHGVIKGQFIKTHTHWQLTEKGKQMLAAYRAFVGAM